MSTRPPVFKMFRSAFAGGVILITLLCMAPMNVVRLRHLSEYAVHVMFFWLACSLVFLAFRREKMMWVTLLAAAVLAVFLRERGNQQPVTPVAATNRSTLSIGLYNTVNFDTLQSTFLRGLKHHSDDLVAIQEVDPYWLGLLRDSLAEKYPYQLAVNDLGTYGMLLLSTNPLSRTDSFWVAGSPVLAGEVDVPGFPLPLRFVTTYIPPLLNTRSLEQQQLVLDSLSNYCAGINRPLVVFGAFNAVTWSAELNAFLDQTLLRDSRHGLGAYTPDDRISPFEIQRDHILHSAHLARTGFKAVDFTVGNRHSGFVGTYQFVNTLEDETATGEL